MFSRFIAGLGTALSAQRSPDGFFRISSLPRTGRDHVVEFKLCDWRPVPDPAYPGCLFIWLEVDGARTGFFLSREEAEYFDTGPGFRNTHVRIVKHRGRILALPVLPEAEGRITKLPPPPKEFPPVPIAGLDHSVSDAISPLPQDTSDTSTPRRIPL